MKKILYIVPILVFAMVALTQDAKAQTQTGNASNGVTVNLVNSVVNNALTSTATGSGDGGNGNNNQNTKTTTVISSNPISVRVIQVLSIELSPAELSSFKSTYQAEVSRALGISPDRIKITAFSAG